MADITAAIDGEEVETSSEPQFNHDNTLPPTYLATFTRKRNPMDIHLILIHAFGICYFIAVVFFALFVYGPNQAGTRENLTDTFCDEQVATGIQKKFVVDIHIGRNLSFTQAKWI